MDQTAMPVERLPNRLVAGLRQAGRAFAGCLVIVASLVVFPDAIPWLIAAWLLAYTVLVLLRRPGLLCLGACTAILVFKRLPLAPGLLGMIAAMLAAIMLGIVHARKGGPALSRRMAWLSVLALWIAWGGMTADWYAATHCHHPVVLKADRPIVCFGDSMTSCASMGAYPRDLQKLVSLPVVDMGIGGISARQGAEDHLPEVLRHNPQAVVIELGGHDYLRSYERPGYSRASTKADLKTIIAASRQIGAEVLLMEIPRAYMSDPFWGLEREIAREEDVELIPDTAMRTLFLHSSTIPPGSWLGGPYLTDDTGIHPNARGNQILAEAVAKALERMYGPRIRKDGSPRKESVWEIVAGEQFLRSRKRLAGRW
jgi:acyl-CoA thioesterase I